MAVRTKSASVSDLGGKCIQTGDLQLFNVNQLLNSYVLLNIKINPFEAQD
jgi:hypothetical protein